MKEKINVYYQPGVSHDENSDDGAFFENNIYIQHNLINISPVQQQQQQPQKHHPPQKEQHPPRQSYVHLEAATKSSQGDLYGFQEEDDNNDSNNGKSLLLQNADKNNHSKNNKLDAGQLYSNNGALYGYDDVNISGKNQDHPYGGQNNDNMLYDMDDCITLDQQQQQQQQQKQTRQQRHNEYSNFNLLYSMEDTEEEGSKNDHNDGVSLPLSNQPLYAETDQYNSAGVVGGPKKGPIYVNTHFSNNSQITDADSSKVASDRIYSSVPDGPLNTGQTTCSNNVIAEDMYSLVDRPLHTGPASVASNNRNISHMYPSVPEGTLYNSDQAASNGDLISDGMYASVPEKPMMHTKPTRPPAPSNNDMVANLYSRVPDRPSNCNRTIHASPTVPYNDSVYSMVPNRSVHDGPAASPTVSNGNHIIEDMYSTVSNNEPLNHNTSASLEYAVVNKVKGPCNNNV